MIKEDQEPSVTDLEILFIYEVDTLKEWEEEFDFTSITPLLKRHSSVPRETSSGHDSFCRGRWDGVSEPLASPAVLDAALSGPLDPIQSTEPWAVVLLGRKRQGAWQTGFSEGIKGYGSYSPGHGLHQKALPQASGAPHLWPLPALSYRTPIAFHPPCGCSLYRLPVMATGSLGRGQVSKQIKLAQIWKLGRHSRLKLWPHLGKAKGRPSELNLVCCRIERRHASLRTLPQECYLQHPSIQPMSSIWHSFHRLLPTLSSIDLQDSCSVPSLNSLVTYSQFTRVFQLFIYSQLLMSFLWISDTILCAGNTAINKHICHLKILMLFINS